MRCDAPTLVLHRLRFATRWPGRVLSSRQYNLDHSHPPNLRLHPDVHAAIKIHSIDTDCRIILDAQINVLADAKTEVARLREVPLPQLVFLDFQPSLEDLFGFGTADGDVYSDLFVTADTECPDSVAGFACRTIKE